jgi:tRNA(fMet)-specific endonuclease VapC
MTGALLDTDILSEYFRGNRKVVANAEKYLDKAGKFNISIITYYEILNGLLYKDAKKQLMRFAEFSEINNILLLTIESVGISAEIQAKLRKTGNEIGHTDTLIAGIALSNSLELVTNNVRHIKRIEGLKVLNWTK